MSTTLAFRHRSGALRLISVWRPDRFRRQGTARAMRRAGWPWWRIALALRVRREHVEKLALVAALFDAPTDAAIRREAAHLRRRAR